MVFILCSARCLLWHVQSTRGSPSTHAMGFRRLLLGQNHSDAAWLAHLARSSTCGARGDAVALLQIRNRKLPTIEGKDPGGIRGQVYPGTQ